MIIDAYICPKCLEPQEFKAEERNQPHICPKCGCEMEFWITENINPVTGKVEESSDNNSTMTNFSDSRKTMFSNSMNKPVVRCPYCNSEHVKKISTTSRTVSTFLFGLGSKKIGKQWHCNHCKSDF